MGRCSLFFSAFLWLLMVTGCEQNNKVNDNDKQKSYPHLLADTLNVLSVGDTFQFTTSENSCCQTFFLYAEKPTKELLHKGLFKLVSSSENIADSDCAGCSSYFTGIYQCVSAGIDTIIYVVIPNSENFELPHNIDISDNDTVAVNHSNFLPSRFSRKYFIQINSK